MPELVLPAGNLEKLKVACCFGADAVYLGGKQFSLRAAAGNFTREEMLTGLDFARKQGKKVYVAVNILAHDHDLKALPSYLQELAELKIDGLIISDLGVLRLARRYAPDLDVTISTQASVTNYEAAALYRDLGAKRIVPARELTLEEIAAIKQKVDIELEVFIHGAMCMSYSGRCLLSHYMTGRSANRGACAHPCRYRYALVEEKRPGQYYPLCEDDHGSYILNSRDLCLIDYIPRLIAAGVDAFKIEGRMKSPLYVASTAATYREAIDTFLTRPEQYAGKLPGWRAELEKTATRPFTSGFVEGEGADIQDIEKSPVSRADFCGVVQSCQAEDRMLVVEQRANFGPGDDLEVLIPGGRTEIIKLEKLYDEKGVLIDRARHPRQKVLLPFNHYLPPYSILRRV